MVKKQKQKSTFKKKQWKRN